MLSLHCKALTRTMVGLPSQLGNQIVDDVCKKSAKLKDCCCAAAVECLWQQQLPVGIRAHVSNMEFTHETFKSVFEAADKVYLSSKSVSLAAVQVAAVNLDETQSAFTTQNQPQAEVAAFANKQNKNSNSGGGSGRGGKNKNKGKGKGQQGGQSKDRGL